MSDQSVTSEFFRELFINNVPFLDVRSKVEFQKGQFPTSYNFPILNDQEREAVGICFNDKGKEAAIKLGHSLVIGDIRENRIKEWCEFSNSHDNAHLYCWRGGMRSALAQQWMSESGVSISKICGGFKALRRFLIAEIDEAAFKVPMIRIGGKTGTSKTILVNSIKFSTDLEGHANHRGSSFGRRVSGVKTQIDFENSLSIDLIKKCNSSNDKTLFLEDESRRIGNCTIPDTFYESMSNSPISIIEMPLDTRVRHILKEYVIEMYQEFLGSDPVLGWELFVDYLTQSLFRVRKRLG